MKTKAYEAHPRLHRLYVNGQLVIQMRSAEQVLAYEKQYATKGYLATTKYVPPKPAN